MYYITYIYIRILLLLYMYICTYIYIYMWLYYIILYHIILNYTILYYIILYMLYFWSPANTKAFGDVGWCFPCFWAKKNENPGLMVNNLVLKWTILQEKLYGKETIPLVHEIDVPSVTRCPFRIWQDMSLSTTYKKNRPHVVTQRKITLKLPEKLGYPKKGQTAMSISDAQQKSVVLASPSQSGNSERWAITNTSYPMPLYSMPAKVPQPCSEQSFPHGTTPPNCQEKSPQRLRPL